VIGCGLARAGHPEIRLAIEYDGRDHRTAERAVRDLRGEAYLARLDWDVLRLDAATVFAPHAVAIRVQRELVARGAANATPLQARW
jgi:very-short-patch-repair endonuclease